MAKVRFHSDANQRQFEWELEAMNVEYYTKSEDGSVVVIPTVLGNMEDIVLKYAGEIIER